MTFYPTALKGCRGIVFTHGVWMGGHSVRWREKVCLGYISESVRFRKLIHVGTLVSWCRCPVKFFPCEIFFLPVFLPISAPSRMRRNGYIINQKHFILYNIQHIVESYRYFYIIFLKLSFNSNKIQ